MLSEFNRLKEWLEDANKLRQQLHLIPESIRPLVFNLIHSIDIISYENILLDEELLILRRKYAKLLEAYYDIKWKETLSDKE